MKSSSRLFYAITVFLVIMTVIYLLATKFINDNGYISGIEWAGSAGLLLGALMTLMLGVYLHITERHSDVLPMDWEEAEQVDGSGEFGFFSPNSIWPFAMTCGIAVLGYGVVFLAYWMIGIGAVITVWATVKLNLQYGTPVEKH